MLLREIPTVYFENYPKPVNRPREKNIELLELKQVL
jgi:hypothetical protein